MKLRILGNSLRLRVTRSEFERIAAGEEVTESVAFAPGSRLRYGVVAGGVPEVTATFADRELRVVLPEAAVERWRDPSEVAIRAMRPAGGGEMLTISVEKDYQCIGPVEEDQSDMFPNPTRDPC